MPNERIRRIQRALKSEGIDTLVSALPAYVLLLSGYWPVIGASFAVATAEGACALLVPEDEEELAKAGWADEIQTYSPSSLDALQSVAEAAAQPLRELIRKLNAHCTRIGYERGAASEPASYAAMHLFGEQIIDILRVAAPSAALAPADDLLAALATVKTPEEVDKIRCSCRIVGDAFEIGRAALRAGMTEAAAAASFRAPLSICRICQERADAWHSDVQRADGFVWCMSGPNSAEAGGAYARSRHRAIEAGELVLVHCNAYADGYWTDVTRTYVLGQSDEKQKKMYEAVLEARAAALHAIRPGARAADVDKAARETLARLGYGNKEFKHSTGHGVGFAAISANARPRLHPKSQEVLETGMVFNVEPAIYLKGYGGLRHCDVVTVTEGGAEILTPFHAGLDELTEEKWPVVSGQCPARSKSS